MRILRTGGTSSRRARWALLLVLLASALTLFVLSSIPTLQNHVLRRVETLLSEALDREVRAAGLTLRPLQGRLDLREVRVAAGRHPADGTLLTVRIVKVRWSWTALLRRSLALREVVFVGPRLTLAPGPSSAGFPDLYAALLALGREGKGPPAVRVYQAAVEGGRATWTEADGRTGSLEGLTGSLKWGTEGDGSPAVVGSGRVTRLTTMLGGTIRTIEQARLEFQGTAAGLAVTAAEAEAAGAHLTAVGRLFTQGDTPQFDLRLGVAAPLPALLRSLEIPRTLEGSLRLDGRLRGPWTGLVFQGNGQATLGAPSPGGHAVRFVLQWAEGRLEIETAEPEQTASLWTHLSVDQQTGGYHARLKALDVDLARLTGLPALLADLTGIHAPSDLRGHLTADLDLVGRGTDLTTLRGHGSLLVEGLGVGEGIPRGRLEARIVATTAALALETFTLRVAGADITGRGSLRFQTGQIDLPVRVEAGSVGGLGRAFGFPWLDGPVALRGRLTGTREAPRFQGQLLWRDPRIATVALDRIEGEVELGHRTLRTKHLVLRANQTTITLRGTAVAQGTAPLGALDPMRDLILDFQGQVNPGRTADLAPLLPRGLEVHGAFRASGKLQGTLQALTGQVEVAGTNLTTWEEPWQRGEAALHFSPGILEVRSLALHRGPEALTGEIRIGKDGALQGRLQSTTLDLSRLGWLAGSAVAGRARFQLELTGTLREVRTLGQATAESVSFRGVPLGPATAGFRLEEKRVQLDLRLREGNGRLLLTLGPPPDQPLDLTLTVEDADLDPLLRLAEIEAIRPWQPRASGRILLRGPARDLMAATGEASLSALTLTAAGETWRNRGPVEIAWRGPTTTLRRLRLESGGRLLDIQGTLSEGAKADLSVKGQVPLATLPGIPTAVRLTDGLATVDARLRGPLKAPDLEGRLEAMGGQFTLGRIGTPFREVQGTAEIRGNQIRLSDLRGRLADGNVRGAAEIGRQGEDWSLRVSFQEDEGRIEQILAGLLQGKGDMTGGLWLGGYLASRGRADEGFWQNLEGDLKLDMRDGRIGRNTIAARILALTNIFQLLDSKSLDLTGGGMPYQRLRADIKIQAGVAKTENLLLESRAMKVTAHGQVNLVDETVDLDVAVKPLQTLDTLVAKIPIAGWLLGGKQQSLLVAYYKVTGPLGDPEIAPQPLQNLGRNLFGIFRRLLEIPESILGPFGDLPPQEVKPEPNRSGRR